MNDFRQLVDQSKITFHQQVLSGESDNHVHNVGIDIGYGSLKVMSRFGLHKIQSLVIPYIKPKQADKNLESLFMDKDDILYIEGEGTPDEKIWAVGKKALNILDVSENYIDVDEYYNKKWFLNKEFQILFNVGMFLSLFHADASLETSIKSYNICIGLPVQWMKYSDELRGVLSGQKTFQIMTNNKKIYYFDFEVKTENIEVIPQHEGTINSMLLDFHGGLVDKLNFAKKNILLIDAGTRTVDTHLLLKNNKGKSKTWLDVSMFNVKNDVCNYISNETDMDREIYEYQLDKYIIGFTPCSIKYGKKRVDFQNALQTSLDEKIQTLVKRVSMVYDLDDVDCVLVAGGTGVCYFDSLKELLDVSEVLLAQETGGPIPFDATLSNVVGYYKLLVYYNKMGYENVSDKKKVISANH